MSSSISAARQALFARLDAADTLGSAQITFGPPAEYEEQEVVALLGVQDPREEPAAIGQLMKEEEYDLEVGVKVHDPAGDAADVDARGFALADAVCALLEPADRNLTLDGTVRTALVASMTTNGAMPAEGPDGTAAGWVIFLRILIRCAQRIGR